MVDPVSGLMPRGNKGGRSCQGCTLTFNQTFYYWTHTCKCTFLSILYTPNNRYFLARLSIKKYHEIFRYLLAYNLRQKNHQFIKKKLQVEIIIKNLHNRTKTQKRRQLIF